MITLKEITEAYKNASKADKLKLQEYIKRDIFNYMSSAQFEILKRIKGDFL